MIFNSVLPVFIVIAVGFIFGKLYPEATKFVGKLSLWVFATTLTLTYINDHPVGLSVFTAAFSVQIFSMLVSGAIIALVLYKEGYHNYKWSIMGGTFSNCGYIAYPIVKIAYGDQGLAYAVVYSVAFQIIMNTYGVFTASSKKDDLKNGLIGIFKIPTLYALIAALILNYFNIKLSSMPQSIYHTVEFFKNSSLTMLLIFIGMELAGTKLEKEDYINISVASFSKIILMPLSAFFLVKLFGIHGLLAKIMIVESAMPTAMNTSIITKEFNGNIKLVSSVIFITTLIFPFFLWIWM
jgi:predicted permease